MHRRGRGGLDGYGDLTVCSRAVHGNWYGRPGGMSVRWVTVVRRYRIVCGCIEAEGALAQRKAKPSAIGAVR